MRTTLNINDATLHALRCLAQSSGLSFKEVVDETLKLGLAVQSKAKRPKPFRLRPHDLRMKPGFSGVSLNQLYDQIESEEDAGCT